MVWFLPKDRILVGCHLPVLFKSCVNDLGETHGTHFIGKGKLGKMSNKVPNYLGNKFKKIDFNKNKCKFLHIDSVNTLYKLSIKSNLAWWHYR